MSDIGICRFCKHINKDIIEKPCLHCAANLGAFEFDLSEHDKKVRAEVIEEVKSKMISFHTDAIFQYGADIIEARADAFDELRDWLEEQNIK